jgi:hypothetical protein
VNGPWPSIDPKNPDDLRKLTKVLADVYGGAASAEYVTDAIASGWTEEQAMRLAVAARKQEALDQLNAPAR